MPRLIDADYVQVKFARMAMEENYNLPYLEVEEVVRLAPTIDPESLRPCGEWGTISINKENRTIDIECPECGATFTIPLFDFGLCYHYCPNCGAKMDEEET